MYIKVSQESKHFPNLMPYFVVVLKSLKQIINNMNIGCKSRTLSNFSKNMERCFFVNFLLSLHGSNLYIVKK